MAPEFSTHEAAEAEVVRLREVLTRRDGSILTARNILAAAIAKPGDVRRRQDTRAAIEEAVTVLDTQMPVLAGGEGS